MASSPAPSARFPAPRLTRAWLSLAIGGLGLSTLCAVALIAARTPYVGRLLPSRDLFGTALVLHVDFAVEVWFLAFAAALWAAAARPRLLLLQWVAFLLASAGVAAMLASPWLGHAAPILGNYLPVLDHPVFISGLGAFGGGLFLAAACALGGSSTDGAAGTFARLGTGMRLAALPVLVAGVLWGWSLIALPGDVPPARRFEDLFWSAGHVVQFAHVTLMLAGWLALASPAGIGVTLAPRYATMLLGVSIIPVALAPALQFVYPVGSPEFREAFTLLMSCGTWPVPLVVAAVLFRGIIRGGARPAVDLAQRSTLLLSMALFALGCLAGAAIHGENTLVPAHYHGTIGAVTLAYMGLTRELLFRFGRPLPGSRLSRAQPWIYGGGLVLLVVGLAWSGALSVPRKMPWLHLADTGTGALFGLGLAGFGGATAIVGSLIFVCIAVKAFIRAPEPSVEGRPAPTSRLRRLHLAIFPRSRDIRLRALALTSIATLCGGLVFAWIMNTPSGTAEGAAGPDGGTIREEMKTRFAQGVLMLHAKRYDDAVVAFHRVLEFAPDLTEAHVDMGYALIGLQRFGEARAFFEGALALRPRQVNAYYGLAVALEGQGDLPGAIGAMRTYVHLTSRDDPYLRKAQAALWEWESALGKTRPPAAVEAKARR